MRHGKNENAIRAGTALGAGIVLLMGLAWQALATEPTAPKIPPYQIPTFDGQKRGFAYIPPIKAAPRIDADLIFRMVVACFPERVKWGLELDAVAGARYAPSNTISTFDSSGLANYYAGIVAKLPLYSADELEKSRNQEYQRRGDVADKIAILLKGIADRRRAERLMGIYVSLEARSQVRVAEGIANVDEQIVYQQRVAEAQAQLDAANASIEGSRIGLMGQCRDEVVEEVNNYLVEVLR